MDADLLRYLDAKFEGVETRISGLQALWEEEAKVCAKDREELYTRLNNLESWRAYLAGAIGIVLLFISGIPDWIERTFFHIGGR